MDVVNARCAGLDVHKATVVAGVRVPGPQPGARRGETTTFATTTRGLRDLTNWLLTHGVTVVTMETPWVSSQLVRSLSPRVVVAKVVVSPRRAPGCGPGTRTPATTVALCTSRPAHRAFTTSMASAFPEGAGRLWVKNFLMRDHSGSAVSTRWGTSKRPG